jgi:phosphopantothenoylcysteine synthetase/decarboxylase
MQANPVLIIGSGSQSACNITGLCATMMTRMRCGVNVVLTQAAWRFVTEETLRNVGGAQHVLGDHSTQVTAKPNHIWLSSECCCVVVYPASAGFIGKMAHGLALDLASTIVLAAHAKPIFVFPSTNAEMWANPLVKRNIASLESDRFLVYPTADGLAPDVERAAEYVASQLYGRRP